ncbi:MAG: PAS domain-containing protein [Nitrospirales bacterium]
MDSLDLSLPPSFDRSPLIVYQGLQKGVDRKFISLSPSIESLLGFSPEYFQSDFRAFFATIHPEDRNLFIREWEYQSLEVPYMVSLEYRLLTEKGAYVWVREESLVSMVNEQHEKVFQGVLMGEGAPDRVSQELDRWDHEIKSLTENLPDIVGRVDRQMRLLYLNRAWDSLEILPPEKYLGKPLGEFGLSSAVMGIFEEKIRGVFDLGDPIVFEISQPIGQNSRIFEFRLFPESMETGRIKTVLVVCRDITEARTHRLAFQESEEKFRQLAETIDSVFWIWDAEIQRIIYVSPAYEKLWGGNAEKLMNNPFDWLSMVVPDDRGRVENLFLKRMGLKSLDIEYRISPKQSDIRWIHNRTFPMHGVDGPKNRVMGIAQDVTERKKWEEERLRSAKLESLGLLAGGLAHDFNNLLTTILGQVSLAKFGLDPSHPLYVRLIEAEKASTRAQEIAGQLLTFSKGGVPIKRVLTLGSLIEDNVRLVLAGSNVRPVFHIYEPLAYVSVDAGQICQVIHNLVINARQAMGQGGECTIHAYNISSDELPHADFVHQEPRHSQWVRIDIVDQGIGVSPDHLDKIFDPYFTTKATGSGLGLATSYSIMRNHGGMLLVDSQVGSGAKFSMLLPAIVGSEVTQEMVPDQFHRGDGKILIMDDELQIRRVLGEMVETCGYSYQTAKDGREALQVFHEALERGTPFSAVILDLTVPGGMGGKEVIGELRELDPHVKGIVVSGYSNDPVLAHFKEYGFKGRVAKPFNLVDLSNVLNAVLNDS